MKKKEEVSPLTRSDESAKPVAKMVEILMIEARLGWPDSENERSQCTLLGTLDPEVSAIQGPAFKSTFVWAV